MAGQRIGALWRGKDGGVAALTGTIDLLGVQVGIAVFKVADDKRTGPNSPEYNIVSYGIREPKGKGDSGTSAPAPANDLPF